MFFHLSRLIFYTKRSMEKRWKEHAFCGFHPFYFYFSPYFSRLFFLKRWEKFILCDLSQVNVRTRFSFPSRPYRRCTTSCAIYDVVSLFLSEFTIYMICTSEKRWWKEKRPCIRKHDQPAPLLYYLRKLIKSAILTLMTIMANGSSTVGKKCW